MLLPMRIFKHLKTSWYRYGFETLAVVVGILSAFALESWRDELQVRKAENEILINLLDDLSHAKKLSSELIEEEVKSMNYLISALGSKSGENLLPSEFFSDSIFFEIFWSVEMDVPVINSYSDIKNTGNTGLIDNEQIRRSFTNLELGINHVISQVDDRLKVQQMRIDELAVTDLNFVRMIKTSIPELKTEDEPENDYRLLLEDQRIRNLLAIKLTLTNGVLQYRRELDAEMLSLIDLLETELDTH